MVLLHWLDAQDAGVAAWTLGVALAQGAEELWEEFVWCLKRDFRQYLFSIISSSCLLL